MMQQVSCIEFACIRHHTDSNGMCTRSRFSCWNSLQNTTAAIDVIKSHIIRENVGRDSQGLTSIHANPMPMRIGGRLTGFLGGHHTGDFGCTRRGSWTCHLRHYW